MSLDEIIKYLIWIFFLGIALTGIFFMLKGNGLL
jgi:hypothetical protein